MGYLDNGVLYNNAGQRVPNNWLNRKVYLGKKGDNGTSSGIESFFENVFNGIRSWFVGKTGQALTGAEQQANEFTHNEAELAFNRELEASNTAYQRKVADLQAAGINPIMAASGAVSLPSSSAATSVSPSAGTFQLAELLNFYKMKEMLPLEKQALKAQIKQTNATANRTEAETEQIGVNIERLRVDVDNAKLDNYSKRVVNSYLERQQESELNMKNASADYYNSLVRQVDKSIEKMDYEECEIFMRCCDYQEHIQYLMKQEVLSEGQLEELSALVKKYNAESRLIGLQADNFDDLSVVGSESSNFRGGPFSAGESHPVTLRQLKERAQARKDELSKEKDHRSMSDIKKQYPE